MDTNSQAISENQVPTISSSPRVNHLNLQDLKAPQVTTQVKTKNPGRVAAGKRLAAISKAARERKKLEATTGPSDTDTTSVFGPAGSVFSYQNILAVVGISIGAAALFYGNSLRSQFYPRKTAKPGSRTGEPAGVEPTEPKSVTIKNTRDVYRASESEFPSSQPKKLGNLESFD